MTADMKKEINWNFYIHTKVDTCAQFQLSRLIFILSAFDSCYQLLTAVTKKFLLDFHLPPKCEIYAKFEVCMLLLGLATECDGCRMPAHGSQLKADARQN